MYSYVITTIQVDLPGIMVSSVSPSPFPDLSSLFMLNILLAKISMQVGKREECSVAVKKLPVISYCLLLNLHFLVIDVILCICLFLTIKCLLFYLDLFLFCRSCEVGRGFPYACNLNSYSCALAESLLITLPLSHCVPLSLSQFVPLCLSQCVPLSLPQCLPHPLSHCVPLCLSQCISLSLSQHFCWWLLTSSHHFLFFLFVSSYLSPALHYMLIYLFLLAAALISSFIFTFTTIVTLRPVVPSPFSRSSWISSYLIVSHIILYYLMSSYIILYYLFLYHIILSYLIVFHLSLFL